MSDVFDKLNACPTCDSMEVQLNGGDRTGTSAANNGATRRFCEPRVRLVTVEQLKCKPEGAPVRIPLNAVAYAREILSGKDREHFLAMHLNSKHRVVSVEIVSIGTLGSSMVHPREVFKAAILANSAAIICAHNHPSGDVAPSLEDREVLKRLAEVGRLLGIPMLDFLIVSDDEFWSASEHGAMGRGASL
ncbi:MAG: JAB domain-containing protein [Planctomycetota bacterium]